MNKYFILKNGDAITYSNWEISENGIKSISCEVSNEDLAEINDGTKEFDIIDGEVIIKPSNKKAERLAREAAEKDAAEAAIQAKKARKLELIKKVSLGTATEEEQEEFANLLS